MYENLDRIIAFWLGSARDPQGGYHGRIDGHGRLHPDAARGAVLNARILWTLSSAYRVTGDGQLSEAASAQKDYLVSKFLDSDFGGVYWSVTADGRPLDTRKQFYAIAFAVYGLSEHYRACGDIDSLDRAIDLYRCIEDHSRDVSRGGYVEACTRDWQPIEDMRLSEKDRNDAKTMNTHLHILEAYTALLRVWRDAGLEQRLRELIVIFLDLIVAPDGHLRLFFDEDWAPRGDMVSYGHDIEASWLLCEAAQVLGDPALLGRARAACIRIASAAMEGFSVSEGMIYEYDREIGRIDRDRHWWVQAETVVGCRNMFELTGDRRWSEAEAAALTFIRTRLVSPCGEWWWSVREDGSPNRDEDLAGFWKCPYHNGRLCMEIMERNKNNNNDTTDD